jgi:hypothetical protein
MNFTKSTLLLALTATVSFTSAFVAPSKSISAFGVKQTFSTRFSEVEKTQDAAEASTDSTTDSTDSTTVEPERFALYVRNLPYCEFFAFLVQRDFDISVSFVGFMEYSHSPLSSFCLFH